MNAGYTFGQGIPQRWELPAMGEIPKTLGIECNNQVMGSRKCLCNWRSLYELSAGQAQNPSLTYMALTA